MEKDFCTVAGSTVESKLLAAHDSRVSHASEVNAVLVTEVFTKHFVENLCLAINSGWLKDGFYWCAFLGEKIPAECSDTAW